MKLVLCLLIFLISCGRRDMRVITLDSNLLRKMEKVREVYLNQTLEGWKYWGNSCDGILFASLQSIGLGIEFDIEAATEDEPGKFTRNPSHTACSTDISRDMYIGIILYSYIFNRLDILDDIWDYGSSNNWVMGKVTDGREVFTPQLIGLLARAIHSLGGPHRPIPANIPMIYVYTSGYRAHLSMLSIYLDSEIRGGITRYEREVIRGIYRQNPRNPLASYLHSRYGDGDQNYTVKLLLDIWPRDRLPNTADWCDEWRIQRADNDMGLRPCSRNQTHSGGDFLFMSQLILRDISN